MLIGIEAGRARSKVGMHSAGLQLGALLEEARVRLAVSLVAGGERLGVLTLDERTLGAPLSIEDLDKAITPLIKKG